MSNHERGARPLLFGECQEAPGKLIEYGAVEGKKIILPKPVQDHDEQ
jgi:hypothetical protein